MSVEGGVIVFELSFRSPRGLRVFSGLRFLTTSSLSDVVFARRRGDDRRLDSRGSGGLLTGFLLMPEAARDSEFDFLYALSRMSFANEEGTFETCGRYSLRYEISGGLEIRAGDFVLVFEMLGFKDEP